MEFARFCNKEGLGHAIIAPYTPQHNGITKRRYINILNMIRTMMKDKEIPNRFWGEAASKTV